MRSKGVLITNAFLKTEKFVEHYRWLQEAADGYGIDLELVDNASRLSVCGSTLSWLDPFQFVLFWDKDIRLGKELARYAGEKGIPVFNSAEAIAACDDKFETYCRICQYNDSHPEETISLLPTIAAPMTYSNIGYRSLDFLGQVEAALSYPVVVKECFGSFGQQVYLAENRQELEGLTKQLAGIPFLYQKYHSYSSGRDVRLQVVGGRVVAAMYRYSENGDFRANLTNGGAMEPYQPSAWEEALAVKVCCILGLGFGGVDLLFDRIETGKERAAVLCEVNSNAHFKNIAACTGVNVAECIIEYIASVCMSPDGLRLGSREFS